MAFTTKYIECDFSLAQGVFDGGGNTHTVSGLRVEAHIVKAGGLSLGEASVSIYGLTQSVMNQLSTFGMTITDTGKNTITIKAGDDPSALTAIYTGTIFNAFMDGQNQPNVPFRVEACTLGYEANVAVPVISQPGSTDVGTLMGTVAKSMNLQLENNGVNVKIANPYYAGTAVQQMQEIAEHAGIEHIADNGTLAIWPAGGSRKSATTIVSPSTGLVGYPRFNSMGIDITAEFQPTFAYGQTIEVQSSITPACGKWTIYRLEYDLACQDPGGNWFCSILAAKPGQMVVS